MHRQLLCETLYPGKREIFERPCARPKSPFRAWRALRALNPFQIRSQARSDPKTRTHAEKPSKSALQDPLAGPASRGKFHKNLKVPSGALSHFIDGGTIHRGRLAKIPSKSDRPFVRKSRGIQTAPGSSILGIFFLTSQGLRPCWASP